MIQREISDKKYQMDAIDGLRGFAILIVVFSHTSNAAMHFLPFLDLRGIGKSGVFLFFLMSSFLLTIPLLNKGQDIFSVPVMSHYWQRRFFRIYPLYLLYLLLAVISSWAIASFLGKEGVGIPFELDWAGFFRHIFLIEGQGVTWSIAVEFKFYFLLPFLVFAFMRIRSFGFGAVTIFFLLLLALSQLISPQSESLTNDPRLLPYAPIFLMGIYLAIVQDHINKNEAPANLNLILRLLGYIGLIGVLVMTPIVFSLFGGHVPNNYFHRQFIVYALFWSFVILSSVNVDGAIQKLFSGSILRFYGALSFGLYLFHPIFIRSMKIIEANGYFSAWFVLLAATATAYISFKFLEGPVSKFKFDLDHVNVNRKVMRLTKANKIAG